MRPSASREFLNLASCFGATCTKGSMMMGIARILRGFPEGSQVPLFVVTVSPFKPLVEMARNAGNVLTVEMLCEYFSSFEHARQIHRDGTIIGHELPLQPKELRPVVHLLLPLEDESTYVNEDVRLELRNLVPIGEASGEGFWAAHMAGRIWIPKEESYRKELLKRQADSEAIDWIRRVTQDYPVIDFSDYKRLQQQTIEAKEECLSQKGH